MVFSLLTRQCCSQCVNPLNVSPSFKCIAILFLEILLIIDGPFDKTSTFMQAGSLNVVSILEEKQFLICWLGRMTIPPGRLAFVLQALIMGCSLCQAFCWLGVFGAFFFKTLGSYCHLDRNPLPEGRP